MNADRIHHLEQQLERLEDKLDRVLSCLSDQYIGMREVCRVVGRSRATVEAMLRDGSFPQPDDVVGDGQRPHRKWRRSTISHWQDSQEGRPLKLRRVGKAWVAR